MIKCCFSMFLLALAGCLRQDPAVQPLKNLDGSLSEWEMHWPTNWRPVELKARGEIIDLAGSSYGDAETKAALYLIADTKNAAQQENMIISWSAKGIKKSDDNMACVVFEPTLAQGGGTGMFMLYKRENACFSLSMQTRRLYTPEFAEVFIQEGIDLVKSARKN